MGIPQKGYRFLIFGDGQTPSLTAIVFVKRACSMMSPVFE